MSAVFTCSIYNDSDTQQQQAVHLLDASDYIDSMLQRRTLAKRQHLPEDM